MHCWFDFFQNTDRSGGGEIFFYLPFVRNIAVKVSAVAPLRGGGNLFIFLYCDPIASLLFELAFIFWLMCAKHSEVCKKYATYKTC